MKILIVDNHILFREGLASLLSNNPDLSVVGEAGTISDTIKKTVELNPDLVLLEIDLPDGSGIGAIKNILDIRPEINVVILTHHDSDELLLAAFYNGAVGYLLKNISISKLIMALCGLENGEAALSRKMTARILKEYHRVGKTHEFNSQSSNTLTMRETEILQILGSGATNRDIADLLVVSENTVKVHVHNILGKLNLRNRREAAQYARSYDFGLPPFPPSQQNQKQSHLLRNVILDKK